MKATNIILSIIILIISCMPCADMEMNSFAHKTTQLTEADSNHAHSKQNDSCSPFCVCSCCGVQVLSYAVATHFDFPPVATIIKQQLPNYTSVLTSNFFGSIWQPPQIA